MDGGKRGYSDKAVKWKAQEDVTSLILWHSHAFNQVFFRAELAEVPAFIVHQLYSS